MNIVESSARCSGIRLSMQDDQDDEVGRAFLFLMYNDLHPDPFGLLEDVWVADALRGQRLGTALIQRVIKMAKGLGCYKLIATSRHARPKIHALYRRLGFRNQGKEFRIDF